MHFSAKTLRKAVEGSGFAVEAIETAGHTKWLAIAAAKSRSRLCGIRLVRSAVTRWTQWTNQADDLALLARKPESARRRAAA